MLHSEPNNWEIFKIPPVQPIQYYSILKKKRDFSQLIKQYDSQVHKHGCLHYCSIVPKSVSSSFCDDYELLIVFLGNVPSTSFIGFRVNVNSETFIRESNSLLLFLKQSKKAGLYVVKNNCIHVQCGNDAWEIFYHLYGIYLRNYVLTVIGTQFFYHFVYRVCFQNEKQLLYMLFRGSKVIRVSKMSIYYRIHRKRKISVTDLIHMTLNMPESKRCVISFDSKESLSRSDVANQNIYTSVGSKIHVSKLVVSKFKKQYHNRLLDNRYTENTHVDNFPGFMLNFPSKSVSPEVKTQTLNIDKNCVQKRKFEETEMDGNEFQNDTFYPKYPKISGSSCLKEEKCWEQYTSLKPFIVKNYSSLLSSNSSIPGVFDNNKWDPLPNLNCINSFPPVSSNQSSSAFLEKKHLNPPAVKETCDIDDVQNLNGNSQFDNDSINAPHFSENNPINNCKNITYGTNYSFKPVPSTRMNQQENISLQSLPFAKSTAAVISSGHVDQDEEDIDDIFTTAAGKSISISDNAMLTAQKFIQDMFQNETIQKTNQNAHCSVVGNKQYINMSGKGLISCAARNYKNDEIKSEEIDPKSVNSNYELGVSCDTDGVSFSTAAGKTINVSNAAMKAAHKLIQDAYENECPSTSTIYNTGKKKSTFKDIGCPPKKFLTEDNDNAMDKALVEKIFQDVVFDEKESEIIAESRKDKDFNKVLESKMNHDPRTRKIRKSLGGRRSMRFYSDT